MPIRPRAAIPALLLCVTPAAQDGANAAKADRSIVVQQGVLRAGSYAGDPWRKTDSAALGAEGRDRFLWADVCIGAGDFCLTARLELARLDGSAASIAMGDSHVGLDGRSGAIFFEGPLFRDGPGEGPAAAERITPDRPFTFTARREGGTTVFAIDGDEIGRTTGWNGPVGKVGLRPWRNRMGVHSFVLEGSLFEPPALPDALFTSGRGGYHTYRIPALAVTPSGTVLAFCEGRRNAGGDSGDIDILLRRSTDGGMSWSEPRVLWDDGANTVATPAWSSTGPTETCTCSAPGTTARTTSARSSTSGAATPVGSSHSGRMTTARRGAAPRRSPPT